MPLIAYPADRRPLTYAYDVTDQERAHGIAWLALVAVATWVAWLFVPGSVIPAPPVWVEVFLPLALFGALLVPVGLALRRGQVRVWLGTVAAMALVAALVFQTMLALLIATFPSDF